MLTYLHQDYKLYLQKQATIHDRITQKSGVVQNFPISIVSQQSASQRKNKNSLAEMVFTLTYRYLSYLSTIPI